MSCSAAFFSELAREAVLGGLLGLREQAGTGWSRLVRRLHRFLLTEKPRTQVGKFTREEDLTT